MHATKECWHILLAHCSYVPLIGTDLLCIHVYHKGVAADAEDADDGHNEANRSMDAIWRFLELAPMRMTRYFAAFREILKALVTHLER